MTELNGDVPKWLKGADSKSCGAVFSFLPLTLDFTAFLGYPLVQGRGRFYAFSTLPFAIAFGVECEWFVFWREPKVS